MGLLDIIFPRRCVACNQVGEYLCSEDKRKIKLASTFCPVCLRNSIGGTTHVKCKKALSLDGLVCLFHYSTPIKEMIHELKYRLVQDIQDSLFKEAGKNPKLKEVDFTDYILLPIPLSAKKKNYRGFNQAEIIGEKLAKKLKIGFDHTLLRRIKDTKPQARLRREERLKQVSHAFRSEKIDGENFLLFDDVWTTGATMRSAAMALKRKGAEKVWGIVLATSRN